VDTVADPAAAHLRQRLVLAKAELQLQQSYFWLLRAAGRRVCPDPVHQIRALHRGRSVERKRRCCCDGYFHERDHDWRGDQGHSP
jgi:hypothetical protein